MTDYYESFWELIPVLTSYGRQLHDPSEAAPADANVSALANDMERNTYMRDHYCALLFLRNADKQCFDQMLIELSNDSESIVRKLQIVK